MSLQKTIHAIHSLLQRLKTETKDCGLRPWTSKICYQFTTSQMNWLKSGYNCHDLLILQMHCYLPNDIHIVLVPPPPTRPRVSGSVCRNSGVMMAAWFGGSSPGVPVYSVRVYTTQAKTGPCPAAAGPPCPYNQYRVASALQTSLVEIELGFFGLLSY